MWNEVGKQALFAGKLVVVGIATYVVAKGAGWLYGKAKSMFTSSEAETDGEAAAETTEAQPASA